MSRRGAFDVDPVDAKIIELIQQDARMPNTAIAKAIGLSEAAVRKRLDRLVRKQIVSLHAHVDPLKVGFNIWALVQVKAAAPATSQVAEKVAGMSSAMMVALVTGDFDVYVVGVYRNADELDDFLEELRRMPGVERTTTAFITRLVKRDFGFGVPIIEEFRRLAGENGLIGRVRMSN
jgi:Lrp/AsnC family transcriptional regulator for asnA, asnC and gidA